MFVALDTSTLTLSLALVKRAGGGAVALEQLAMGPPRKQSEMLPGVVMELLARHGVALNALEGIAVGRGHGEGPGLCSADQDRRRIIACVGGSRGPGGSNAAADRRSAPRRALRWLLSPAGRGGRADRARAGYGTGPAGRNPQRARRRRRSWTGHHSLSGRAAIARRAYSANALRAGSSLRFGDCEVGGFPRGAGPRRAVCARASLRPKLRSGEEPGFSSAARFRPCGAHPGPLTRLGLRSGMSQEPQIAVVGATGAVGQELLAALAADGH